MSLADDNRKEIVTFRIELLNHLFTMRLKGDYSDRFGLTESDVLPYIEPTEAFIKKFAALAQFSVPS